MATVLKALLQQRHIQTLSAFNREYDRHAMKVDSTLVGAGPKKAQFYRWLSGEITGLPYPHHCRVLQSMFPDRTVDELFRQHDAEGEAASTECARSGVLPPARQCLSGTADVDSVFPSRIAFTQAMSPQQLFGGARTIDIVGISLNLLCQQYSDREIVQLLESGTAVRCLFLDPEGKEISRREAEEGQAPGALSGLTALNIGVLQRIRENSGPASAGSLQIRTYDETARFNIVAVDSALCVVQPYLPLVRGLESPTLVARKSEAAGIFDTFVGVFDGIWARGKGLGS
ncbi:DUF5919 domain-containing protein [Nocardia carnea]|uniref:DUF5919 domain-containing protein n=1 Tax=Nocardia carnea TaxID=37328 RepID=A0ABW7TRB3_9NOCA|nr:DUF5919 domain-containing protein [Nocardia carnea]